MKIQLRSFLIALVALAAAGPAAFGQAGPDLAGSQAGAVVKDIVFVASEKALEVVITIMGECVSQPLVLSNPPRLVVDFAPALKLEAKSVTEVNAFGMTNIRTGMFQPMIARVIFDFSGEIPAYTLQKTEAGLTVRFTRAEAPAAPQPKPVTPPVQEKPAPPAERISKPAPRVETRTEPVDSSWPVGFTNTTFGIFGGSYSSPSADFTDVYGTDTSFQYGLNLTRTLLNAKGFQVDATFELRTFSKTGKATLSGDEAKLSLTPITIGGRILYQAKYIMPFIGFGADFYNYEETSALANTTGSANGSHFQGGLYVVFPKAEFLRLKIYYKYTKITATENGIDIGLGGPEYGVGLTFGFNVLKKAVLMF